MRLPLAPVIILLVISIAIDWLIFRPIFKRFRSRAPLRIFDIVSTLLNLAMLTTIVFPKKDGEDEAFAHIMWLLFTYMSVFFPKIFATIIILLQKLLSRLTKRPLKGLTYTTLAGAGVFCAVMWWGALINRNNTNVIEVDIPTTNLPKSFDGYRIAHISDIHCGTYIDDTTFLTKVVKEINQLKPDVVVVSGDIVNRHSKELIPFTETLGKLHARHGVYSIMGNHDYGDYYHWQSPEAKLSDINHLKQMQTDMGWKMLNNSHDIIRQNNDSIIIIGVENIGDPPFQTYGDLSKAYTTTGDDITKILISHNPAHWTDSIADNTNSNIALTLSGHTHAMQTEIFGLSPAALRYPTWGGLYSDNLDQHLYVNIGLGTVAFPMRVGATPEITILTLKRK